MGRGRGVDRSVKGGIWLLRGRGVHKIGEKVRDRSGASLASSDHFRKGEVSSVMSSHVNVRLVLSNRFHRNISRGGGGGSGSLGEGRWRFSREALGRPAVETATVRGPVGGLLWRTAAEALGREGK